MKRTIINTADGSHSVYVEELRESFHSQNGSIQESLHTFMNAGLNYFNEKFRKPEIRIFEVGFGTGLNALLAKKWAHENQTKCLFHSIEAFPLEKEIWQSLNYHTEIEQIKKSDFFHLHECEWNVDVEIDKYFILHKHETTLQDLNTAEKFNVVFFDAFAPGVQPELWKYEMFKKVYSLMEPSSVMVTYSAANVPRQAMVKAGFWIEELRGAAGKKEMTRALKW